jgi:hypothetical protein
MVTMQASALRPPVRESRHVGPSLLKVGMDGGSKLSMVIGNLRLQKQDLTQTPPYRRLCRR